MQTATRMLRRLAAWSAGLAVLAACGLAWAGPEPESGIGFGFPRDISEHGHRIDWLIEVTGIFVIVLFVIMVIWMGVAMVVHNKDHKPLYDHGNARRQTVFALSLSAVIFFVVDGNLFVNSIIDLDEVFWNFEEPEAHPDAVRIQVNAHQWAWDFRYAGNDGVFNTRDDVVLLNDMRVPVDVPVIVQLAAVDVLHSFYLPNLRVKMDVVPGTITRTWFIAKEEGEWDIACAQHCGTHHYKMKGMLTTMSRDEYEGWIRQASAYAERGYDPDDATAHWGWDWKKEL